MRENISVKVVLTGLIAAGTEIWGWFGWIAVLWVVCMVLDYASGTLAAVRKGEWNSKEAREGLWHKAGEIFAVVVSVLADIVIGLIIRVGGIELPFDYTVLISVVVLAWYVLTELGSVAENAVDMGAPVPAFLRRILKISTQAVEQAGEQIAGGKDNERE